ncbi:MAG: FkbM family methyltransferase [Trichodesmium sp.]
MIETEVYLHKISNQIPEIFCLEIGAMDGKSFDLLHKFIKQYKWHGVLVEPVKDMFELLKINYSGCENLYFENSAITDREEIKPILRIPINIVKKGLVPIWAKGISSFYDNRNAIGGMNGLLYGAKMDEKFFESYKKYIVQENVNCITLEKLISKYNVNKVDVLQIDTEGSDYQIFKQFDLNKFQPYFIKVEVGNLPRIEYQEIKSILEKNHYDCELNKLDLYAQKKLD